MPYNAQFTPIPTLLPPPKSAQWKDGFLDWNIARFEADSRGMPAGEHVCSQTDNSIAHDQGYYLKISEDGITIKSRTESGARLAFQTLRQIALQSDERGMRMVEISDYPDLEVRGFMLDISRCKVPTMDELSRLLDKLALFKYNRLELYTEHTYAFSGHEIVWADASPMTKSKYARLQKLCDFAGIELVANMNGLGHMERWLRYPQYAHLAESKAPFIDPLGTVRKFPTTLYPDKKITAIFQPHLYTRTRDFYKEFADSLSLLDEVILLDIYPAREQPIPGITSQLIYDNLRPGIEKCLCKKEELIDLLKNKHLEVLITLGAGDIDNYIPQISELLKDR